jgi:hypothetical protein
VGIGTTAPLAKLQVTGTARIGGEPTLRGDIIIDQTDNATGAGGLEFKTNQTSSGYGKRIVDYFDGSSSYNLQFQSRSNSATWSTIMTLANGGNVGIGTTTPATTLHVVAASGNAGTFSSPITIGYPSVSTDAARKDYVDTTFAPITGASGIWKLSGSNIYASSTSYNVGIGNTSPLAPLNVTATSSLATSTETIRLSAPQNYTAGFGPKLSFWNGTSEQLALISGVVQTTSNGNFGSLHFGTRTTDALGVQTKMSILASGSVGIGTTTPANRLSIVGGNISIQPDQVIGAGLTFDSPTSAASSSIELYDSSTGDLTIRTGYTNGDILLMPRQYVGIGTTTPSTQLHVVAASGNAGTFSAPITIGYPSVATDAARKDYVDSTFAPISGDSGVWKLSGNNLYASSTSYNVGIGTAAPATKLEVNGTETTNRISQSASGSPYTELATRSWGGNNAIFFGAYATSSYVNGDFLTAGNTKHKYASTTFGAADHRAKMIMADHSGVGIYVSGISPGAGQNVTWNQELLVTPNNIYIPTNSVGIGEVSPGSTLSVSGMATIGASYDTTAAPSNGLLVEGSVGIGTTTPASLLTGFTNNWNSTNFAYQFINLDGAGNEGNAVLIKGGSLSPNSKMLEVQDYNGVSQFYIDGVGKGVFSDPVTIGYPVVSTDAARKDYVDTAIGSGSPTAYATSSGACDVDATCEMQNADFGGSGNITGVGKLTVTTIDPLYEIKGKKYSTYASAITGGVKEEYVGRGEMKRVASGKWQLAVDFDKVKDASDLWVWRHAVDFSEDNIEVLATPIGVPVPVAYEIKGNKIVFFSESTNHNLKTINFSYRLIGKRLDWAEWPTYAKDQSEKPGLIFENYLSGYRVK